MSKNWKFVYNFAKTIGIMTNKTKVLFEILGWKNHCSELGKWDKKDRVENKKYPLWGDKDQFSNRN